LVCFNLMDAETSFSLAGLEIQQALTGHGLKTAQLVGEMLKFSAFASYYAILK